MNIIINNQKDYKKFINKIIIYKSFLYRNIQFKLENNIQNEELNIIINALNIKNKNKRIEYIYDEICKILNKKIDFSICKFKNNKCIIQRKNNSKNYNGCCLKCKNLKNGQCNTENITCKLLYCPSIKKKHKIVKMKDIQLFKLFSIKQRLILKFDFFSTREEVLQDLKSHLFIITTHKIFKRNKN